MPVINYREFPFEVFPVNATPGTFYCMLTVVYASGWGYNMMQSNQAEFLQTAVVAAPFAADGQFDNTQTTANQGSFLETWAAWATGISVGGHGSYAFS
jgi:cytochrome b561